MKTQQKLLLFQRILLACFIPIVALILPKLIVQETGVLDDYPTYQHLLKSIFVGLIAITGVYFLRSKLNKGKPFFMGLTNPSKAFIQFGFGFGLVALPLFATLFLSQVFGWAEFTFNSSDGLISIFLIGLVSTFFTDAFNEEFVFRGYVFGNLKEHFGIWYSSAITLVLFVSFASILMLIQNAIGIQNSVPFNGGYFMTLIFFGAFMQYLRVITKSIWAGVGFHLIFVHMNKLMGITDQSIIQFSETSNELALQITLIVLILLVFLSITIFPIIKMSKQKNKKKIDKL